MTQALAQADAAFNGNATIHAPSVAGHSVVFWESEFGFWRAMSYDADHNLLDWCDGEEDNCTEVCLRGVLAAAHIEMSDAEIAALVVTAVQGA